MPVPEQDAVCRFVRAKDWHKPEQRPKAGAFKARGSGLSVWHPARLQAHGAQLEDLQFGPLDGTGQAHYVVGDFARLASKALKKEQKYGISGTLDVSVRWSPEHVTEEWQQWAYAHIDVYTETDCQPLAAAFRRELSLNARHVVPPSLEPDC